MCELCAQSQKLHHESDHVPDIILVSFVFSVLVLLPIETDSKVLEVLKASFGTTTFSFICLFIIGSVILSSSEYLIRIFVFITSL